MTKLIEIESNLSNSNTHSQLASIKIKLWKKYNQQTLTNGKK